MLSEAVQEALRGLDKRPQRRFTLPLRTSDEYIVRRQTCRRWADVASGLQTLFEQLRTSKADWPLYLCGDVGRGKTLAALAFCDQLESARYWTVGDVMDEMIRKRPPWHSDRYRWGGRVQSPNLTVLDELGTSQRDFEYDAVKRFCDWRENLPTIYISNHPAEGDVTLADVYDKRIHSRVTCGTVFELTGPDRRFEQRAAP